uniref:Pre-mRNA-splicing regulator female-lethal(2)D n=2 Tax=Lygus hesperus TaxID=30085 RepID=A0A0K8SVK1_LYGHE
MSSETGGKSVPEDGGDGHDSKMDSSSTRLDISAELNRIQLSDHQVDGLPVEELRALLRKQDSYISALETRNRTFEESCAALRENEDKLKTQITELSMRERVLMRRLAAKEQDMQEYADQLSEMKLPGGGALKSALLDPAVNLLLQRLRQELSETKTKLEDTQSELAAWKFTPDSNTGKRLMARCRQLHQENDELGSMISKGRLAKLESELALQKSFSEEVKKSQSDLDELLQDLDEDVEGMQSTIYYLQQELRKTKQTVAALEQENASLRTSEAPKSPQPPLNGLSASRSKWRSLDSPGSDTVTGSPRTKDTDDSGVNNNVDDQRKRTASETSDENSLKKPKTDNQLTVHYSDDEVVVNGENGGQ